MTSRPNVPVICPSASSIIRSAASHPPGPLGRVPRPHRYLSADSDFSPPLAPRFVSFARHYHRLALLRSPGIGRFPEGLDHFYRGARAASHRWRRRDIPGSWTTLAYMPRSSTPADRRPRPLQDRRCGLPHFKQRRLRICPFRGSITRPARSLCTLRSRGRPRTTQHSIPAGGQPLPVRTLTCWVA